MVQFLHSEPSLIKRPKLETALLQFSQPHIRFSLIPSLNDRSEDFWRDHLTEYFPALRTRNGVSLKAKHSLEKFGHDSRITTAIAISADSRWAATGSDDDTIIIWDLSDGSISQEWFVQTPTNGTGTAAGVAGGLADPHPRRHLTSLCFSPDSLYLMSTGLAPGVTVWNICRSDTPYKVASLGDDNGVVQRFMWSPDGDSILAKFSSLNGIMCKWEASTLQELSAHRTGHGVLQVLSPNGRWLLQVTGVSRVGNIWDVASGELRTELRAREPTSGIVAGVFDPSSTRLAAGYSGVDSSIRIWDVESGQCLLVLTTGLRTSHAAQCHRVEYSPDGKLILSMFTSASGSRTCIWSASKGALIHCLKTPDYGDPSHSCFSPCSRFVASISAEGSVVLWWTHDGSSFAELSGPNESPVEHVAITPDGRRLCYGCDNGTVFFCDIIHEDDPNATMIW